MAKLLGPDDIDILMNGLIRDDSLSYEAEELLATVAAVEPQKVIKLFEDRMARRIRTKDPLRYDAIPYQLGALGDALRAQAATIVPLILEWYKKTNSLYGWEANHLFKAIFPGFEQELEDSLSEIIAIGTKAEIKNIVMGVLRAYEGESFVHNICKTLIRKYPGEFDSSLFIALGQTGGVSGEYGFRDAYKRKKAEVKSWRKESDPSLNAFLDKYNAYLDANIAREQKRGDDDVASMDSDLFS
jgi:hypothetical protein